VKTGLEKTGGKTKIILLIHLEIPFIKMIMFNLFAKRKISKSLVTTLEKLKQYCEAKVAGVA
jgi:hypothetical protein